jgi:hypothetical protein
MKEFKGTKGEWKLSSEKTFGRQMIDLGDFNGCIDVWHHSGESMTKEEALANCKLIVAAQDLLKLANFVYEVCDKRAMPIESEIAALKISAKQAIEKALSNA